MSKLKLSIDEQFGNIKCSVMRQNGHQNRHSPTLHPSLWTIKLRYIRVEIKIACHLINYFNSRKENLIQPMGEKLVQTNYLLSRRAGQ